MFLHKHYTDFPSMYKLTNKDKYYIFINKIGDIYWNYNLIIQIILPLFIGFLFIRPVVKYFEPDFYDDEWNLFKEFNIVENPIRFFKKALGGYLAGMAANRMFYNMTNYFLKTGEYIKNNNHLLQVAKTELCEDIEDYMIDNIDVTVIKVADKYPTYNDFLKERKFEKFNIITGLLQLDILCWDQAFDNFLDMFNFKYNLFLDNTYYMDKSVKRLARFKDELLEKTWQFHRIRDWIDPSINQRW